jgi:DNA polymerase-3 subunit epsilon
MKYLVIDTETSGLFDFRKPADAEGQPRLASLAMISLDEKLETMSEVCHYVKPDGWTMPAEAMAINGLTMEHLNEVGVSIREVLGNYAKPVVEGAIVVAYNAQYDLKVMRGELRRLSLDDMFEKTPNICAMRGCTDILKIPSPRGFKFPKLAEACDYFGIKQRERHTALDDARSCAQVLRKLMALGKCPEPKVHFAKVSP